MKHCTKCDKSFPDETNFCPNCGRKLETKPGERGKTVPWIILAILLLAGAILLPTRVVNYQVEIPYNGTEQYTVLVPYVDAQKSVVEIPYETTEQYVDRIPTGMKEPIKYAAAQVKCTSSNSSSTGESTVTFTNVDSESGEFTIQVGYIDASGNIVVNTYLQTLLPSIPVNFTYTPTPELFQSCYYGVTNIPLKPVYTEVVKERNVTKFREEITYQNVTKFRNETRVREITQTRIETRQKEVNWLFGFDAIVKFRNLK
ncbi:Uncharacterised protein [uncultured archaeon]|nr:Uncharacterised protein [uncultured archaeon]